MYPRFSAPASCNIGLIHSQFAENLIFGHLLDFTWNYLIKYLIISPIHIHKFHVNTNSSKHIEAYVHLTYALIPNYSNLTAAALSSFK